MTKRTDGTPPVRAMDRNTCWECGHRGADVYECHVHKLPFEVGRRVRLCGHCINLMRDVRMYVDVDDWLEERI